MAMFVAVGCSSAISNGVQQQDALRIQVRTAAIDRFGHLYYATADNEVVKFDEQGSRIGYYSNNSLGNVALIDATNPLKVLIYYPDFYTVVILDRLLNEAATFNMIDLGFNDIRLIASALDGNMWIFSDQDQKLQKVDRQGQVLQEGEDLRLRFGDHIEPTKLQESQGQLYLQVPGQGLLVFDLFGQYKTQLIQKDIEDFQVHRGRLIYQYGRHFEVYDPENFSSTILDVEIPAVLSFKILLGEREIITITPKEVQRRLLK